MIRKELDLIPSGWRDIGDSSVAVTGEGDGRRLIAIIGIDGYTHTQHWQRLTNAVSDARAVLMLFERLGFEQAIPPLIDAAATERAVRALVTDELVTLRPDDSLVIFYAGHGGNRRHHIGDRDVTTGYLIPVDADNSVSSWVNLEAWLQAAALLPARHILVILDACHSGIALDPVIKWRDNESWRREPLSTLSTRRSRRIITSALGDQRAMDGGPYPGQSLFTGCLIEALTRGRHRDSDVGTTGSGLGVYLQQRVGSYPHAQQTPDFGTFALDDRGDMLIIPSHLPIQERDAEEIQKILAETAVYMKYGLPQKGIDHLNRAFALDADNVEAHERLKELLLSQGRKAEAEAELLRLAELVAPRAPDRAELYLQELLALSGTHTGAHDFGNSHSSGKPEPPASLDERRPFASLRPGQSVVRPQCAAEMGRDHYGLWAVFELNDVQQRMRWIPPGTFMMGSPPTEHGRFDNEGPRHKVALTRGYWLGETPVTQALWAAVMGEDTSHFRGESPDEMRPVRDVSWDDCQAFLERLNDQVPGLAARLPTEAEWERACRARTTTATWIGEIPATERAPELEAIAWYRGNSGSKMHPVGCKAPNPYGLYDMLGNVWEWCADEQRSYEAKATMDPTGTGQGPYRISRGGSWADDARHLRAASRCTNLRSYRCGYLGLRLAGGC